MHENFTTPNNSPCMLHQELKAKEAALLKVKGEVKEEKEAALLEVKEEVKEEQQEHEMAPLLDGLMDDLG